MTKPEKLLMDLAAAVRLGEDALIEQAVEAAIEAGEAFLDREEVFDPDEPEETTSPAEAAPCLICGAPTCAGCGACGEEDCPALSGCTCAAIALFPVEGPMHLRDLEGSAAPRCGAETGIGLWTAELLKLPAEKTCPTCRQVASILAGGDDETAS